jgi:hypothetical protein
MSGNYSEGRKILVQCTSPAGKANHGRVPLSDAEYSYQLNKPNSLWFCPECGFQAVWIGIFYSCRADGCDGWVNSETDDCCEKCGKNAYELFCEQEENQ